MMTEILYNHVKCYNLQFPFCMTCVEKLVKNILKEQRLPGTQARLICCFVGSNFKLSPLF